MPMLAPNRPRAKHPTAELVFDMLAYFEQTAGSFTIADLAAHLRISRPVARQYLYIACERGYVLRTPRRDRSKPHQFRRLRKYNQPEQEKRSYA